MLFTIKMYRVSHWFGLKFNITFLIFLMTYQKNRLFCSKEKNWKTYLGPPWYLLKLKNVENNFRNQILFLRPIPTPWAFFFLWGTKEKKLPLGDQGKWKSLFLWSPKASFFFLLGTRGVEEAWCNLVLEIIFDMCKKSSFFVLGNVKVASAKFFNFGFYCRPNLFFICHHKN